MKCELVCTMYETNNLILPPCRCFSTIWPWCTLNGFATTSEAVWRVSLQNLQVFQSFDSGNELLQMAESEKEKADSEKVSEASTAFNTASLNHSYAEYINPKQPLRAGNSWKLAYHGTWFYSLWSILYHGLLLESSNTSAGHSTKKVKKSKTQEVEK